MDKERIEYNPLYSRIEINQKLEDKEFIDWYENKFKKVPLNVRLAISGKTAEEEVQKICDKFGISDWQKIGYTARIIRDIFCDNLKEAGIKEKAVKEIGIKEKDLNIFLQLIKKAIKEVNQAGKKEYEEMIDKMTL